MILSDFFGSGQLITNPDPTSQVITDPDPGVIGKKFRIQADPHPASIRIRLWIRNIEER